MTNHIHLDIDPGNQPGNLSFLMKRIAGRQTRYINTMENEAALSGRVVSNPAQLVPTNICLPVADMWNSILFGPG